VGDWTFAAQFKIAAHFAEVLGESTIVKILTALAVVMYYSPVEHLGTPSGIEFGDCFEEQIMGDCPNYPVGMGRTSANIYNGFALDNL
jgi:hypothetical protein